MLVAVAKVPTGIKDKLRMLTSMLTPYQVCSAVTVGQLRIVLHTGEVVKLCEY